jgi:transposase
MRHIGIDLHSNNFTTCLLDEQSQPMFNRYRLNELASFTASLQPTDQLAVEATSTTRFFYTQVSPFIDRCVMVNPGQFAVISQSVNKTDKNDALRLAQFLSKGLLPEARIKAQAHAQLSSLANTRDKLVKLRTSLINKVHAILKGHGMESRKEAYSSEARLKEVLKLQFSACVQLEMEVIVSQIRSLNEGIKKLDRQIAEEGAKLEGCENLTSIKGIGIRSAAILLSIIGDVRDFENEDKLASYFGIVPRVSNSNESQHHGAITKRGTKLGRTTLVQCTLTAKRYSPYLANYYERIKRRRGSGKALIATTRKFLGIIYRTLKNNWVFADFPNYVLAEAKKGCSSSTTMEG